MKGLLQELRVPWRNALLLCALLVHVDLNLDEKVAPGQIDVFGRLHSLEPNRMASRAATFAGKADGFRPFARNFVLGLIPVKLLVR